MSADYGTEHYQGYYHDDGVAIFTRKGHQFIGRFSPEEVSELQSMTDQWRHWREEEAKENGTG
jgi:hypothetical protein